MDDVADDAGFVGPHHEVRMSRRREGIAGGEQNDLLPTRLRHEVVASNFDAEPVEDLHLRFQEGLQFVVRGSREDGGVEFRVNDVGGPNAFQPLHRDVLDVVEAEADEVQRHKPARGKGFMRFRAACVAELIAHGAVAQHVQSLGVRVPKSDAESTRKRLQDLGVLRIDLEVGKHEDDVVFPVSASCGPTLPTALFDFKARLVRPAGYQDLLTWPKDMLALAPRAFEQIGDIVVVKVPPRLAPRAAELGTALRKFARARAVFSDDGVKEEFRVRDLERISGIGEPLTQVQENGIKLWVDLSKAYFSPRLATERERVAALVQPGEHLVDLFGGVAPFGIQAALKGARVDSVDLNPAAIELAKRNVAENKVEDKVKLHLADAKLIGKRLLAADRIIMNLPHGAKLFLDIAAQLAKPGATIHYHEILTPAAVPPRGQAVLAELARHGKTATVTATRIVRNYSPSEAHVVFDLKVAT